MSSWWRFGGSGDRPAERPVIRDDERDWLMKWSDLGGEDVRAWSIVWEGPPNRADSIADLLRREGFNARVGAGHLFWPPFTSSGRVVGVRHRLLPCARGCLIHYGVPEEELRDLGPFPSPAKGWKLALLLATLAAVVVAFALIPA